MANHKVYFELIDGFMNNAESLIAEGQRRLYAVIGGDVAKWEENEQALLQKGAAQYMMMVQGGLREKLKSFYFITLENLSNPRSKLVSNKPSKSSSIKSSASAKEALKSRRF
jgi:hypothetical protein